MLKIGYNVVRQKYYLKIQNMYEYIFLLITKTIHYVSTIHTIKASNAIDPPVTSYLDL